MSRSKDRERLETRRRLNPDYPGFRGAAWEPTQPGNTVLQTVTCSVCGRKRNVPLGVAQEQGERYVCLACQERQG
ncbi:MAG: hypothetical protein EXR55_06740 [Dehalococcoidia bacterium]|nr:hypothetical protein [Dehalococcoidia bacterium]